MRVARLGGGCGAGEERQNDQKSDARPGPNGMFHVPHPLISRQGKPSGPAPRCRTAQARELVRPLNQFALAKPPEPAIPRCAGELMPRRGSCAPPDCPPASSPEIAYDEEERRSASGSGKPALHLFGRSQGDVRGSCARRPRRAASSTNASSAAFRAGRIPSEAVQAGLNGVARRTRLWEWRRGD